MKKDDLELFERAMETLGVKPQPQEKVPRPKAGPVMPTLPDEDLDFDAIMRSGRGPAKLEAPAKRVKSEEAVGAKSTKPVAIVSPRHFEATAEERVEFLAAMAAQSPPITTRPETAAASSRPTIKAEPLAQRVKRQSFEVVAQLDLHGATVAEARPRIGAFLVECVRERWELVAIVCGRGVHSKGGNPVLKPRVTAWLQEDLRELAAEVVEAPRTLGGSGTLIVRVRLDPGQ
jgi:DNA-nicking Smr family endonuclease